MNMSQFMYMENMIDYFVYHKDVEFEKINTRIK